MALLLGSLAHKLAEGTLWNRNLVLTGDFNRYDDPGSTTCWRVTDRTSVAAINAAGYTEIDALVDRDTNVGETEGYDRFFVAKTDYCKPATEGQGNELGGVFDPFEFVIRNQDHTDDAAEMMAVYDGSRDLTIRPSSRGTSSTRGGRTRFGTTCPSGSSSPSTRPGSSCSRAATCSRSPDRIGIRSSDRGPTKKSHRPAPSRHGRAASVTAA